MKYRIGLFIITSSNIIRIIWNQSQVIISTLEVSLDWLNNAVYKEHINHGIWCYAWTSDQREYVMRRTLAWSSIAHGIEQNELKWN